MSLPPIRRQVVVPAPPDRAFDVFTRDIGAWWPVHRHSVHGAGSRPAFAGGELVETGPGGERVPWGSVLAWEPPHRLRITWHPGYAAERAGEVEVTFAPADGGGTLVTLTHHGWDKFPDPEAARESYGEGWPLVLAEYVAAVPSASVGA